MTMNKINTFRLSVKRAKCILVGLSIAVALCFPQHNAGAGQVPVNLGSAGSFTVLAATSVMGTGGGMIDGDVGVWTGNTFVVGFPPVIVMVFGRVHLGDTIAAQAQADLTTAFNDAAGRFLDVVDVTDEELGGKTLVPGLYRSVSGSFAITSVDLTLDAQGDPYAVWIFQMPSSTLTVGNGRKVLLAGGARAGNIFWQVGSSATLGTTSVFNGNILAQDSISMNTGARLDGSALTRTGAVTLDNNILAKQPLLEKFPWALFMPAIIK